MLDHLRAYRIQRRRRIAEPPDSTPQYLENQSEIPIALLGDRNGPGGHNGKRSAPIPDAGLQHAALPRREQDVRQSLIRQVAEGVRGAAGAPGRTRTCDLGIRNSDQGDTEKHQEEPRGKGIKH